MTGFKVTAQDTGSARAQSIVRARLVIPLICVALSAAAVIPFFFLPQPATGQSPSQLRMPITHDMGLHYDQMRSFYEGLRAGKVYPRWEEDTNRGFGAPTTSYYPPGIYYVTALTYRVSGDWTEALMWAMLLIMALSGWAIYAYARSCMSRAAAAVTMSVYMVMPYHLVDQYQRGAIAELTGFVWMPLMMMGADRLMRRGGRGEGRGEERGRGEGRRGEWMKWVVVMGASYGGFVWTHPPTAYQYGLMLMAYVVLMGVIRREWKGMMMAGVGMVMGLGISAAYLLPAALEQNLIRSDHIAQQYPYHDSYVLLFLRPNPDHYYAYLHLVDRMWIFYVIVILVAVITLLPKRRAAISSSQVLKEHVFLWVTLGVGASFMMTAASKPIGVLLPKIEIGVFAWRMLSIVTLVCALMAGALAERALDAMKQGSRLEFALRSAVALLIVLGSAWFSWQEIVKPCYRSPAFKESPEHLNLAMQPRSSQADIFKLPVVDPATLAMGNGRVSIERWEPERRSFQVELTGPDRLLIRTFNFPGWTAAIDGERVEIIGGRALDGETQLGDIAIELPQGAHRVTLDYEETPIRRAGGIITLSSVALLIGLACAPLAMRR